MICEISVLKFVKNSYVAKNQTKVPAGVTFWAPVYLTMKKTKKKNCYLCPIYIFVDHLLIEQRW